MEKAREELKFGVKEITDEALIEAARESTSWCNLYKRLGITFKNKDRLENKLKKLQADYSHIEDKHSFVNIKISKELLEEAVRISPSKSALIRVLGLGATGKGTNKHVTQILNIAEEYGIDIAKGKTTKNTAKRYDLNRSCDRKMFLLSLGVEYKCSECGMLPTWNGKALKLHVDHVDGDRSNNSKENLRFLCPNCRTQTETYSNSAGGKILEITEIYRDRVKYMPKTDATKTGKPLKNRTKITWPEDEELKRMLTEKSMLALSKELGISDKAIKKRCLHRKIDFKIIRNWTIK